MLEEARRNFAQGIDIVVGYVEPHKRDETSILLLGLEVIPSKAIPYKTTTLQELDLDAVLARRPAIVLVDELAHTNVPGSRFEKRHQDVDALLNAGISVYTTLNVQHLESLNDVIAQITGTSVRETIPDRVFDAADDVELVDLAPDALLERLREGKVYVHEFAREAVVNFFRKGNLTALRELALRRTAQWVDGQMRSYKREHGIDTVWPASERILVGVDESPRAAHVLRGAKRLALGLRADLIAVHVATPPIRFRPARSSRDEILRSLRLAESLGAEVVTLTGQSVSEELVKYAKAQNVSKIVIGRSRRPSWLARLLGSDPIALVQENQDLDVFVIHGDDEPEAAPADEEPARPAGRSLRDYAIALAMVAVVSGLASLMVPRIALANVVMVYLLGVILVSATCSRGASVFASILSVAAFDFFFVPPSLTFAITDTQYLITFAVMLFVALFSSHLTARIREQAEMARAREQTTAALYSMSRELAAAQAEEQVIEAGTRHVRKALDSSVALLLVNEDGKFVISAADRTAFTLDATDLGAAQWANDHGRIAGKGTATLPAAQGLYLPLAAARGKLGVLGVKPHTNVDFTAQQLHFLETLARQFALALERTRLIRESQQSQLRAETERMRNALLSTVSHDLRTPLAVITGNATALLTEPQPLTIEARRNLVESIVEESARLNQIIDNLVFATRLESGAIDLHRDWISIEETVGAAIARLKDRLTARKITTFIPENLPLVRADGALLEQAFVNILENVARYTPAGTPVEIHAWRQDQTMLVKFVDHGPGLPEGEEHRVFDRFYRGSAKPSTTGLGLGLYICRGIIAAHGGRVWAERGAAPGAVFSISLPLGEAAPEVPVDETPNAPA
jgi:two-component system sensor histidine kinase KdpD